MKINIAVMAGGQSRRFDGDKTLELFDGKPLIMHPLERLQNIADDICIVAKDCSKYAFAGVPCVRDAYEQQCPMVGVLTALKHFQSSFFAVSADAPFVSPAHVQRLAAELMEHHVCMPDIDGRQHPMYAYYNLSIIPFLEEAVANEKYSLMQTVRKLDVKYLNKSQLFDSENDEKCFININTRNDYKTAIKYIGVSDD